MEFVNEIFRRFKSEASGNILESFNLDRIEDYRRRTPWVWKPVFPDDFPYTAFVESAVRNLRNRSYEVDPLLLLALIRRESNFDASAVSSAGAAGLSQIMPRTALDLGVRTVFYPSYLNEAEVLLDRERKARAQATDALYGIQESNKIASAAKARTLGFKIRCAMLNQLYCREPPL